MNLKRLLLVSCIILFFMDDISAQGPLKIPAIRTTGNLSSLASPQVYCIPPATICGANLYLEIDSIGFSNLHNTSGCGANGYTDYSTTVAAANVQAGTYTPIAIKFSPLNIFTTKDVTIGTDFNHNGTFEQSEIQKLGSGTTMLSGYVRIPFTSMTGTTVMRIRAGMVWDMCSNVLNSGETEDYLINISAASTPGPNFSFYVNNIAAGSGNGFSWANAFTDLAPALSLARPYDTIRVAKGTYVPGTTSSSYYNLKDSVLVLGGYPNVGNPGDELRNWSLNQTILSAKFGPNFLDYTVSIIYAANRSLLDGFILEANRSSSSPNTAALMLFGSVSPQFKHCIFRNNFSCLRTTNSSPVFSGCIFINNSGSSGNPVITNKTNSNVSFINCLFYKNTSFGSVIENDQSTASFTNCDFVTNFTDSETIKAINNSAFVINNSIFYNNQHLFENTSYSIDSSEIGLVTSTISIANTITQVYDYGNISLLSKNPKFIDTSSVTGPDGLFFTPDDGLQLVNPCSPVLNQGSNAAVATVTSDILGNQRVFGTTVDLGAYEVQAAISSYPSTLYVNKLATGNGNGSSWLNAFTDLQKAIEFCSDTIRVAAGTYNPSVADEKKSFWLQNHRVILGGYPNTGSPTDAQRDPVANPTVLSGALTGSTEKSDVIIRGRTVDSTAITDGFKITNAEAMTLYDNGAIFLNRKANPIFRNCIISENINDQGSALVTIDSARPTFKDCIIENNNANVYSAGGAIGNYLNSSPFFLRCIFRNNSTYMSQSEGSIAGAVYNVDSNPIFDSCTFYKNAASSEGGAFYNYNSNPVIRNCIFNGNIASAAGVVNGYANDLYNNQSSPQVFNTKFYDSTVAFSGGCMVNINGSNPYFKQCEFHNSHALHDAGVCDNDQSSPIFESCIFADANSTYGFGAVANNANSSNPVFVNCVAINNNTSSGYGSFMFSSNSSPIVKNCTFVNNLTGPNIAAALMVNGGTTQLTISNSIFWNNFYAIPDRPLTPETHESGGSVTIMNNCITMPVTAAGNGNLPGINPLFVNESNPAGADGIFYTNDDGLALLSCSPALNAGLNNSINGFTTDILTHPRIYNGTTDIGAYEYQGVPAQTTNTFTGTVSNAWEIAGNWSLGVVPNACSNIIINSSTVLLNSDTVVWTLTVNSGGQVTVASGYNLTILH